MRVVTSGGRGQTADARYLVGERRLSWQPTNHGKAYSMVVFSFFLSTCSALDDLKCQKLPACVNYNQQLYSMFECISIRLTTMLTLFGKSDANFSSTKRKRNKYNYRV